jgi:hypothetical protein
VSASEAKKPATDLVNGPLAFDPCSGQDGIDREAITEPKICHLHFGGARTPLVTVVPDRDWPGMYRVHWPDRGVSPMANLTRCREAARRFAEAGPPKRDPRGQWEWRTSRIAVPPDAQGSPHTRLMRRAHAEP